MEKSAWCSRCCKEVTEYTATAEGICEVRHVLACLPNGPGIPLAFLNSNL